MARHLLQDARPTARRRARFAFQAALSLCCLLSLATTSFAFDGRRPVKSLQEIRREKVIVQKWDVSCGAAALATVLTYGLNYPITERDAATGMLQKTEPLKVKHRGGFSLLDMKRFVGQLGFKGLGYKGMTFDQLLELNSPIVPITQNGYPHFVIVRGLDAKGRVDIADPAFGNRTMSVAAFEGVWDSGIGFTVKR